MSGTSRVGTAVESVLSVSVPLLPPGAVGAKLVGTVSLSPAFKVTGKFAWPRLNSVGGMPTVDTSVLTVAPVMVTVLVAVTVTPAVLVEPTAVGGIVVAVATSGAAGTAGAAVRGAVASCGAGAEGAAN